MLIVPGHALDGVLGADCGSHHHYVEAGLHSDLKLNYKSYRTHGTVENKIESFSTRFSIFYDSMSRDCDLYHTPSFQKLKAEPFISVLLHLLLFAFGAGYKIYSSAWFNFSENVLNLPLGGPPRCS